MWSLRANNLFTKESKGEQHKFDIANINIYVSNMSLVSVLKSLENDCLAQWLERLHRQAWV